jgi:hypothetical protein
MFQKIQEVILGTYLLHELPYTEEKLFNFFLVGYLMMLFGIIKDISFECKFWQM